MNKLLKLIFAGFIVLMSNVVSAADNMFLTGAEVTSASSAYLYVGTSLPLPASTLAKGYVFHIWADYLIYDYKAGSVTIDAEVHSLSGSIGYHDSGVDYWWNARAGIIQSDTSLSPDDSGNESSGLETGIKLQLEGEKQLTADSKINANIAFVSKRSAYWARVRYLMRNDDETYHGPEIIFQGDANYEAQQLGWVLTQMRLNNDWDVGVKAGLRLDDGEVSEYVGIELGVLY